MLTVWKKGNKQWSPVFCWPIHPAQSPPALDFVAVITSCDFLICSQLTRLIIITISWRRCHLNMNICRTEFLENVADRAWTKEQITLDVDVLKYLILVITMKLIERPNPQGILSGSKRQIKVNLWERNDASGRNSSLGIVRHYTPNASLLAWVMETSSDFTVGLEFIFTASPCKCCFPPPPNCFESFPGIF